MIIDGNLTSDASAELRLLREQSGKEFLTAGIPHTGLEDWRFTNVSHIGKTEYRVPIPSTAVDPNFLADFSFPDTLEIQVVNGHLITGSVPSAIREKGITIKSLVDELNSDSDLNHQPFNNCVETKGNAFPALNLSGFSGGVFIHIPDGTVLETPIHILNISSADADNTLVQPRSLIIAGSSSQITIIEHFISSTEYTVLSNSVTEIDVGDNSHLDYYHLQDENSRSEHIFSLGSIIGSNSNLSLGVFDIGCRLVRNDTNVRLNGEGSHCALMGLPILSGSQHLDNHAVVSHDKPNCTSNALFKGILKDKSHMVFNGLVRVAEGANGTDAVQTNRNLLLSDHAQVNSNPQLEIYTDDVKCSHGSATGQLDEDALFYLRSRGIAVKDAIALMMTGFANEVLESIRVNSVRDLLAQHINRQLSNFHNKAEPNG